MLCFPYRHCWGAQTRALRPQDRIFDESSFKLTAFTMESFQGLGKDREKLVDQLPVHGTGGGNSADFITAGALIQADVDTRCLDWRAE